MPPKPRSRHNLLRLVCLVLVLAGAVWVVLNRQFVIDQLTVWNYKPSSDIAAIAFRASLNERGTFYLYASRPQINDRDTFNSRCHQLVEKAAVLGCYANREISIFNVTDQRLDGIREVTAAHEMLHAAYDRLTTSDAAQVNGWLEQQIARISDPKLKERLALYDQTEPGERLNELHSIIGTEIATISPELETYYARYFSNRSKVVTLANQYEAVFGQLEDRQKTLISEMNALADQIDSDSKWYETNLTSLQADIADFNRRATAGDFASQAAFVAERSQIMARQSTLQSRRLAINAAIDNYSQKKAELDSLTTTAEGLQRSINSKLPETPTL